ncbi:hypothetical protein C9J20_18055 [Photobacterium phosphoreum]|uniref:hypothetical protein n=1 Tax=Photobacterium phosphoreum TaxID=659 RepID=UPI000D17A8C3|nr:hypothetical protein [Photobacterium phosphoreum]PSU72261.1 hypothetical protein CTM79_05360 [Photobacterium phosphoreum]PSW08458.1 hypothetical protein C9J20_18055 [Photobacterium phosphoreum]
MSIEEWNEICAQVSVQMIEHVKSYITPISRVISDGEGEHLGTGSYFELDGERYLITNEHVAKHLKTNSLTHKFWNNENIFKLTNPAISLSHPVDVAISKIDDNNWGVLDHEALAIPFERFSKSHNTVEHELLFFAGYSGERSNFYFGFMNTPGTPYLTQELPFPTTVPEADPKYHFALHYSPDKATSVDGTSSLPDPHGFSGSLVWDTKVMACIKENKEWSPELAEVTGIVWGWPSVAACILVTKVEHLNLATLKTNLPINA